MRLRVEAVTASALPSAPPGARRADCAAHTGRSALALLVRAARVIPAGLAWQIGGVIGEAIAFLPLRDAMRCRIHLAMAYPDRDAAWVRRTACACFRHAGSMALWTLCTLHRPPATQRRGVMVEGADNLRALVRAGRRGESTLIISGHVGAWELLARLTASLVDLTVVGRRLRSPAMDAVVRGMRLAGGVQQIDQEQGVRPCLRVLRDGRVLGTLPDQDVPRLPGVAVPWFGRLAHTPRGPAQLALLARCPVQPAFCYRRAGRWVMHWGPRLRLPASGDRDADVRTLTAWMMAYQEALVRRVPEQWVWWHRRWRTQTPAGEPTAPDGSAGPGH